MTPPPRTEERPNEWPLAALLRATRGVYTGAVRRAQAKVGCTDIPATGDLILSAMEWSGSSLESIVRWIGVTKQAVGQAVDTLVDRGYLERSRDPSDRRRVLLSLTARGHAAGKAARSAIEQVDRELEARVGAQKLAHARETLLALVEIKRRAEGRSPRGRSA